MGKSGEELVKNEVRYFWLRDEKNRPVACIASEKDGMTVRLALAIHNPKDKFDKKMGRAVALARLRGNKHARFVSRINGVGVSVKNVKKELLEILSLGRMYTETNKPSGSMWILPERVYRTAKYRLDIYKEPRQIAKEKESA